MHKLELNIDDETLRRPSLLRKLDLARKDFEIDLLMNYNLNVEKRRVSEERRNYLDHVNSFSLNTLSRKQEEMEEEMLFSNMSLTKKTDNIFEPSYHSEAWDIPEKISLLELFDIFRIMRSSNRERKRSDNTARSETCPRYERFLKVCAKRENMHHAKNRRLANSQSVKQEKKMQNFT